jgi:TPR repeat protein
MSESAATESLETRAVRGDVDAMWEIYTSLSDINERQRGIDSLKKAAAAGHVRAMFYIAQFYKNSEDWKKAEKWYEKAAELGEIDAMFWLGYIAFNNRHDEDRAQSWYRKAAENGDLDAMGNIGFMFKQRGDFASAETWYLRASELGHVNSMEHLGFMHEGNGRFDAALTWYEAASELNSAFAFSKLGEFLAKDRKFGEAESKYRKSIDLGNDYSMVLLGQLRMSIGDRAGARYWFNFAAEKGVSDASENLVILNRTLELDKFLNAIEFDTFGWQMCKNAESQRAWCSGRSTLLEMYMAAPPDLEIWDEEFVRKSVLSSMELREPLSIVLADVDLPEALEIFRNMVLPDENLLLDLELFEVGSARGFYTIARQRQNGMVNYLAAFLLLFRDCYWIFQISVAEEEMIGEREGAVAAQFLDAQISSSTLPEKFDPYGKEWDGLVPLESDPLTRARLLAAKLRDSLSLGPVALQLDPWVPVDD